MENKRIIDIHTMPQDKMIKYFNMTLEESLTDFQRHVDMGKICEDTVVFPPGREIQVNFPEDRKHKMLGPDLTYRNMGWSKINPTMYGNIVNKKTRADIIIDNIKHKKHKDLIFSFKRLIEKLIKIRKKEKYETPIQQHH